MSRARWIVRGRVQGVMFRASARERAEALGLSCEASNRDDGSVEIAAEGAPEALDELDRWVREGPALSRVESVERRPG